MFAVSTLASLFPLEHKKDDMDYALDFPFDIETDRIYHYHNKIIKCILNYIELYNVAYENKSSYIFVS